MSYFYLKGVMLKERGDSDVIVSVWYSEAAI